MASALPNPDGCCNPCDEPVSVAVPGPQGDPGSNGADGSDGINAFTTVSNYAPAAQPVMPAELGNVTLNVADSTWMEPGQVLYIEGRGYMEVQSKPTSTSVILKNLEDTGNEAYAGNSPPGTSFTAGIGISPGGVQGPDGTDGTSGADPTFTYITKQDHTGAGLPNSQPLALLATGYAKVTTGTGAVSSQAVPIPITDGGTGAITAAAARTALGAAPSTASFITQVAEAGLSGEQDLASLATGYVKVTTGTGVLSSQAAPIPITDLQFPIETKSASDTLTLAQYTILADASGGAIVLALPTAASAVRKIYNIKKIDATANAVTIDPNLAELLDGAASLAITVQWTNVTIQSNGTAWYIL